MKAAVAFLAAMLLAGCVTQPPVRPKRVTYLCERGPSFTVVYAGDIATIVDERGGIELKRKSSGSGIWYELPTRTIRGKGNGVVYRLGRMAPMACSAEPASPAPQH